MWEDGLEECWAHTKEKYDKKYYRRPVGWGTKAIAGGAFMLCSSCVRLLCLEDGTMSHILIDHVYKNHGIKLGSYGDVVEK